MMSAAHIQPGNLRQKFSKLLLYRLQCFLQIIRILFAERMKMQSVDPFQTFPVKVLSGNPQPGTRRTGIIDRMIPLSGAFRINTESQTGSGTHFFKFLQLCCGIKDNMVTDTIQFLYIFCTVSRGKNMILFPHLFISKPCLKQTAGSGTCQIFSDHGIQGKAGKRFLRQKDLTPGILLDFFQNLQILPHLLTKSLKKKYDGKTAVILVATSGDTGKAALEGFKDVEHTKIVVFYPVDGVSPMQKHQMNTQEGENVRVCAIKGNFDDAQTGVKKIFTTPSVAEKLAENNMLFSSANSINWGRLVPQIVYYFSSYAELVKNNEIEIGDKINVVVPTGNFGNILASYYASLMGLPINKFICASNSNNVLTDFIKTGVYDKNRNFYTTISPSMDILVSSNLERLLYKLSGDNDEVTRGWMNALKSEGKYEVSDDVKAVINEKFYGGFCDDKNTEATIHEMFEQDKYLCDTHTAVAINVYKQYVEETGDKTPSVIASTASPYKFSKAVLEAVEPNATLPETEFDMVDELYKVSGAEVPAPLANLKNKTARFSDVTEVNDMENYVLGALGID